MGTGVKLDSLTATLILESRISSLPLSSILRRMNGCYSNLGLVKQVCGMVEIRSLISVSVSMAFINLATALLG